jgi:type IV secretion system protein VirB10
MTQTNNPNSEAEVEVADDMPLLDGGASAKNSNMVTIAGFFVISVVCVLIAYWSSTNNQEKEEKKAQTSEIRNALPSITYKEVPAPAPQPPTTPSQPVIPPPVPMQTPPPRDPNAKPLVTPDMRKMEGNVIAVGSEQVQPKQEQGTATAITQNSDKSDSALSNSLKPTKLASVSASKLPNRNLLITKGATLGCVLETALDSSLSGLATCRLTRDVYSDNGAVILLDKGSQVIGEYQGGMKQGQKRLFLLWSRVETPNGAIINIDSPSTDPVGRTGVDGWVDNHFAERFGAAILVTIMQDVMSAGTSYLQGLGNSGGSSTTTNISSSPQAATAVVTGILNQSAQIPPTLNKNQGDEIQIMIARDLDFSTIYALKVNYGR